MVDAKQIISIFLPDLSGGGAERVAVNLANSFIKRGYLVDMVLLKSEGVFLAALAPEVNVISLNSTRMRHAFFPLVRYLRIRRPDAMLACIWPLTVIAQWARILTRSKTRLIVAEHSTMSKEEFLRSPIMNWFTRTSMHWTFPRVDKILTVSNGAADDLALYAKISRNTITTVYNPIVENVCLAEPGPYNPHAWWTGEHKRLLAVGSFKHQKNFNNLITAFSQLLETVNAKLLILGEGELRDVCAKQAEQLGISKNLFMPGFAVNPKPYYQHAQLFILSSEWEGFGNVVVEALAAGTPVVSTDCPSGPREILDNGKFGRLVPVGDAKALTAAMTESLAETHDTLALMARAQIFSIEKAVDQYEDLLFDRGR